MYNLLCPVFVDNKSSNNNNVGGDRFAFLLCIGHLEPEQGGVLDGCVRHAGGFVGPWQAGLRLLV